MMKPVARTLLRTLLRRARCWVPNIKVGAEEWAIPGVSSISSRKAVERLILFHFRTRNGSSTDFESAIRARDFLSKSEEMLAKVSAERDGNIRIASKLKEKKLFEIGDVILHNSGRFRCLCYGWRIDESCNEQLLDVLIDDIDLQGHGPIEVCSLHD
jgi:hypothetical protein